MTPPGQGLKQRLARRTREGELWVAERGDGVRCFACGHRCFIPSGRDGICKVRFNDGGKLRVPWGYVGTLQLDPIEKKPFFHALPGTKALSFGMLGCDLHCAYCQNWLTSQTLRDAEASGVAEEISAEQIVRAALQEGASALISTYNEPLITAEWAMEIFRLARRSGLKTGFVSNGNGTSEVLDYLAPHLDFMKIDLKGFSDKGYRQLGGVLDNVLRTIRETHERGIFLELVTLLVPGFNDSDEELAALCRFVSGVSRDIPWHVSAFHPDYRMRDRPATPANRLVQACELARREGLRYVYAGNLPGLVGRWESTFCPRCDAEVISRRGFQVTGTSLDEGACRSCHEPIPGVWR